MLMKNLLLSLMFLLLTGLAATAATSYGFKVGNVEVTTANYNNVTGNDIITGTVSYNPSTNVLTLNNASISCSNSGEYAIHNINRPGLVIKCVGDCYLSTQRSYTINMEKSTTIEVTSGGTMYVSLYNSNSSDLAVFYSNNVPVTIKGPGFMNVNAETSETSSEPKAFKGSGKKLDLPGGITCLRKGRKMIIFAEKGNKLSRAREEKEKRVYERKNFASDCTE